jgi:hypothetical protein
MKKNLTLIALLTTFATSTAAFADWSPITGETVGEGNNVIHVQAGFPGISGGFLHGMAEKFDLGARLTFNYGLEGTFAIVPGLKPAAILKIGLMEQEKFNMALRFEPGLNMYFSGFGVLFGIAIPVALDMGIRINEQVAIPLFVEMPMGLNLTPIVTFGLPIRFGGGVEYKFKDDMALTFAMRFGPYIGIGGFGAGVGFSFDSLIGIAFKL